MRGSSLPLLLFMQAEWGFIILKTEFQSKCLSSPKDQWQFMNTNEIHRKSCLASSPFTQAINERNSSS